MRPTYTSVSCSRGSVRIPTTAGHRAADRRARLQAGRLAGTTRAQQPLLRFCKGDNSV